MGITELSEKGKKSHAKAQPLKRKNQLTSDDGSPTVAVKKPKVPSGQSARESASIYDTLKDRNIPWSERLALARYVWVNVETVPLPFRENLIIECLCTGLVNVRKSNVSDSDIRQIWKNLAELLQCDRVADNHVQITLKNSFVICIVEELKKLQEKSVNLVSEEEHLWSIVGCTEFLLRKDPINAHLLRENSGNLLMILEFFTLNLNSLSLDTSERAVLCLTAIYKCYLDISVSQLAASATSVCSRLLPTLAKIIKIVRVEDARVEITNLFSQFIQQSLLKCERQSGNLINQEIFNVLKSAVATVQSDSAIVNLCELLLQAFLLHRKEIKLKSEEGMAFLQKLASVLMNVQGSTQSTFDSLILLLILKKIETEDLYDPNDSPESFEKLKVLAEMLFHIATERLQFDFPRILDGIECLLHLEATMVTEKLNDVINWCHLEKEFKSEQVKLSVELIKTYAKLKQTDVLVEAYVNVVLNSSHKRQFKISTAELKAFGIEFEAMGIIQAHNVAKTLLSGLRTSWEQKLDGNAFKAVQLALLFDGLASNIQPVKTEKCVQTSLEEVTILTDQIINGEPLWQQVSALLIVSLTRLITVRVRYGRIEKLSEIEKRFVSEPISLKSSPVKSKRDETAASLEICVSILLDREDMDNQISMAKAIVKGLTAKLTPYCEDNFCSRLLLWNLVMSYWPIFAYFLSPEKEKFTDILAISLLSSECDNQHKCGPKIRSFLQERLEFAQFWESAIHLESSFLRKLCERGGQMINSSICLESHIIREYEAKPAELLKLFATQVLQSNRSSKLSGLKNECVPAIDSILHVLQLIPLTSDTLDYYLVLVFVLNTLNRCNSELQMVKHSVESLLRLLKIFDGRSVAMPEGFWDWIILNLLQRCEELLKLQNQFSKSQSEVLEFRQICLEVISDVFSRQDSWSKLVNSFTNVVNKLKSFDWEASFQSEVYLVLVKEISVYLDGVDVETLKIFVNDQRFKSLKTAILLIDQVVSKSYASIPSCPKLAPILLGVASYFDEIWMELETTKTMQEMMKFSLNPEIVKENQCMLENSVNFPLELFDLKSTRIAEWRNKVMMSHSDMLVAVIQQRIDILSKMEWTTDITGCPDESHIVTFLMKDWEPLLSSLITFEKQREISFPSPLKNPIGSLVLLTAICRSVGKAESSEDVSKFLQATISETLENCSALGVSGRGRVFVEMMRFITAALTFNMAGKVTTHLVGYCLTLASQLPLVLAEAKSRQDENQSFSVAFNVTTEVLNVLLVKFPSIVVKMIPSFTAVFQYLLKAIVQQSGGSQIRRKNEIDRLVHCARLISRLCVVISGHSQEFGKVSAYILASYVDCVKGVTLLDMVETTLKPGIYRLLDLCDKYGVSMLLTNLQPGSTDVFKLFYEDYRKFFKYSGFV